MERTEEKRNEEKSTFLELQNDLLGWFPGQEKSSRNMSEDEYVIGHI